MLELARRHRASSLHITFPPQEQYDRLGDFGLLQRLGVQYHWPNDCYAHFAAFLESLASRKRKSNNQEHPKVAERGLLLRTLSGGWVAPPPLGNFITVYRDP